MWRQMEMPWLWEPMAMKRPPMAMMPWQIVSHANYGQSTPPNKTSISAGFDGRLGLGVSTLLCWGDYNGNGFFGLAIITFLAKSIQQTWLCIKSLLLAHITVIQIYCVMDDKRSGFLEMTDRCWRQHQQVDDGRFWPSIQEGKLSQCRQIFACWQQFYRRKHFW